MNGPFEVELKVRLTDGDREAVVSYSMPAGAWPTKPAVQEAMGKALKSARKQLGTKWRLATRPEFQNLVLAERTGQYIEFASKSQWDE